MPRRGAIRPSRRAGMGAVPYEGGTTFRVWAPHAAAVFVTGTFDGWAGDATTLAPDGGRASGTWSGDVAGVGPGSEYRFTIRTPAGDLSRLDPYARQVTGSVGNAVVYDPGAFDWGEAEFRMPTWNDIVIYEMHIGTFAARAGGRGDFDGAIHRLPYLAELGIGAIQVMPPFALSPLPQFAKLRGTGRAGCRGNGSLERQTAPSKVQPSRRAALPLARETAQGTYLGMTGRHPNRAGRTGRSPVRRSSANGRSARRRCSCRLEPLAGLANFLIGSLQEL